MKNILPYCVIFFVSLIFNSSMAADCCLFNNYYGSVQPTVAYYPINNIQLQSVPCFNVQTISVVPVIVQERRLVSVVENRLSYVPVVTNYTYYPVPNYYTNQWIRYNY